MESSSVPDTPPPAAIQDDDSGADPLTNSKDQGVDTMSPRAVHQSFDISGSGNYVFVAGRDLHNSPPQPATTPLTTARTSSQTRALRTFIALAAGVILTILAAFLVSRRFQDEPWPSSPVLTRGPRLVPPPTTVAHGDTLASTSVASSSIRNPGKALNHSAPQRRRNDSLTAVPASAEQLPNASGNGVLLSIDQIVRTDGRSIFVHPESVLPGACSAGARVVVNATPSFGEKGCTNGVLVFHPLDPRWKDALSPNTLYCLSFALPGEQPMRFPDTRVRAEGVLTSQLYIGFRVESDGENRTVVLSNASGRNRDMPCNI